MNGDINLSTIISTILKRQILNTLLQTIEDYEFSNVASQVSIQVLYSLKSIYDDWDLELLKDFVKRNLSSQEKTHLQFESGNRTTKTHLASIINMAIELRKMTIDGGLIDVKQGNGSAKNLKQEKKSNTYTDSEESDESDDHPSVPHPADEAAEKEALARSMLHINDTQWTKFCSTHLKRFEKKWTTKLEDYQNGKLINDSDGSDNNDSDGEKEWKDVDDNKKAPRPNSGKPRYQDTHDDDDDEEDEDEENFMQKMLEQGMKNRQDKVKRDKIYEKPSREEIDNANNEEDKKKESEFFANNYWLKPNLINDSLDDLLKSEGF